MAIRRRPVLSKPGERFGVKGYFLPQRMVDIAEDRTMGFQSMFVHYGARAKDLGAFARSCYMQGIHDATDAVLQHGWIPKDAQEKGQG